MSCDFSIIVVEDNDLLRCELVSYLRRPGWLVHGVDSGETLDLALRSRSAHLIVLDVGLPFEDGVSIAKRLRASQPDLRIVILTARTSAHDRLRGLDAGADAYLDKPANLMELERVLCDLQRRNKPQAAPH
jgi:DNA-binding response OmpR family regulator